MLDKEKVYLDQFGLDVVYIGDSARYPGHVIVEYTDGSHGPLVIDPILLVEKPSAEYGVVYDDWSVIWYESDNEVHIDVYDEDEEETFGLVISNITRDQAGELAVMFSKIQASITDTKVKEF